MKKMTEIGLISADSHVLEPPDLWTSRVPRKFQDRAPHMVRLDRGDAWIIEGAVDPINFGLNQCGGLGPEQRDPWIRWEDVRPEVRDPEARLRALDQDGVAAEILYPTPRLGNSLWWNDADPELHLCLIRAYNDWLSEFCAHAPDRYIGLALLPNVGTAAAIAEFRRARQLPGIGGIVIGKYPTGRLAISKEDDALWAELEAAGVPVSIHVSLVTDAPGENSRIPGAGRFRFFDAPLRASEFIESGVFDRFPNLALVLAEVDCGWVPYVREQLDHRYRRTMVPSDMGKIKELPGAYFDRNIFTVFITDSFGIQSRHAIGVNQMMWSSDFAHSATNWPNSRAVVGEHLAGASEAEQRKILAGNAAQVYKLAGRHGSLGGLSSRTVGLSS
jgi:predicted TIM-barrel fold metal-dependent hydrolase